MRAFTASLRFGGSVNSHSTYSAPGRLTHHTLVNPDAFLRRYVRHLRAQGVTCPLPQLRFGLPSRIIAILKHGLRRLLIVETLAHEVLVGACAASQHEVGGTNISVIKRRWMLLDLHV